MSAYNNATMESFHALLRKNVLNSQRWESHEELRVVIIALIERTLKISARFITCHHFHNGNVNRENALARLTCSPRRSEGGASVPREDRKWYERHQHQHEK